ncbi:MAG: hypothetical protein IAF38_17060 [Bacteroidia bacterium]|nr:hypothetical protein [Bacteroidia bacterium]
MAHQTAAITSHAELELRIMQLNLLKAEQEIKIKINVKEIGYSLQPQVLVKKALKNLSGNPEVQQEIGSTGLTLGTNFLIGKLMGKNSSIKGYLASVLMQKVSSYFFAKHPDLLSTGISKLSNLFKKT